MELRRWRNLTESEQIKILDSKEFSYVFYKEKSEEKPKEISSFTPFAGKGISSTKIESTNKQVDLVEKKRALKKWKQSFGYYCLHPKKFKFGLTDL